MAPEDVQNGGNSSIIMCNTVRSEHTIQLAFGATNYKLLPRLRRVYILFNAKHGLNQVDRAMLASLDEQCQSSAGIKFTLQAVITKADLLVTRETLSSVEKMQKDIFEAAPTCLPAILTVALKQPHIGIEELRRSIAEACGLG